MTLARSDGVDLLTALHEGPHDRPRWSTFLARMQRRTRADHVSLIVGRGDAPVHRATQWFAGRDVRAQADQLADLAALDPTPYHRLRPGRVYSAMEMIDPADARHSRFRREYLERIGVRFGRFMRVGEPRGRSLWLSVTRIADDFSASDSALLSSLAPHLSIALRTFCELEGVRLRTAVADEALRRAGIGWTMLDPDDRALDAGGAAPAASLAERGAATLPARAPRVLRLDRDPPLDLLAVPAPRTDFPDLSTATTVLLTRRTRAPAGAAADALARLFTLSPGEARLAVRIAAGDSLADAAVRLGLTIETARNYSKRLFFKTGTRGQADLVRLVLTSVASLA